MKIRRAARIVPVRFRPPAPIFFSIEGNMAASTENDEQSLCARCISNAQFAKWIEENGSHGKCDFDKSHGRSNAVVTVEAFAEEVDRYFRDNYQRGEEYMCGRPDSDNASYDTYGEPYQDILGNDLECDEDVFNAVVASLPDCSDRDIAQGDEPFYDDCVNYESTADAKKRSRVDEEEYWYENRFSLQWGEFCRTVQFRRRFFKTKEPLDRLFGKPEEYHDGAVKPIYELKVGERIFRARILDDDFNEVRLQKNPPAELSAPPKERARAGRMNVEYIPAFYGAFSEDTALAEMRPSIGDQVAIGEFALQKNLKVFDFTVFSKATGDKWKEVSEHTRYDFITQMEHEISKPILPFEKQREYIATQIVAEYLREYFECDAVIFRSSMHGGDKADNRNIVIFYKGAEFVGKERVLTLSKHHIANVMDVFYRTSVGKF
ncbi:MAG TPA: RES domain-containing protein [Blastocatellia bacterium]|nr:RES domain-containing protein [Blastocatellia bacterium]